MIEAIKECNIGYNFMLGETVNKEAGDIEAEEYYKDKVSQHVYNLFQSFVPYGEYGIHTIESIEILNVESEEKLL